MSPKASSLYFEHLADDFEGFMSEYDIQRRIQLIFCKMLPADRKFGAGLEIGCGTGRISQHFISRVGELTVTDISAKLALKVGERLGCRQQAEDACALSFPDNAFDLVISSECIEHTPNPFQALSEIARVVKPGGGVLVTTPNKLWFPALYLAQLLRVRKFAGIENWIWPHAARRWFRQRGFTIQYFGGCHLLPWQLPGAKAILPWFDKWDRMLRSVMINFGIYAIKPAPTDPQPSCLSQRIR